MVRRTLLDDSVLNDETAFFQRISVLLNSSWVFGLIALVVAGAISYDLRFDSSCQKLACRGDFPAFYSGGALAFSPDLYSSRRQAAFQQQHWPTLGDQFLYFAYPPHTAAILSPLALLSPGKAKTLLVVVNLLALSIAVFRISHKRLHLVSLLIAILLPTNFIALFGGQNTGVSFLLLALCLTSRSERSRGLALGVWWFKPQFAFIASIGFIASKQWKSLVWSSLPLFLYFLLSCWAQGIAWPLAWLQQLSQFSQQEGIYNSLRTIALFDLLRQVLPNVLAAGAALSLAIVLLVYLQRSTRLQQPNAPLVWFAALVLLAPRTMYYDFGLILAPLIVVSQWQLRPILLVFLVSSLAILPDAPLSSWLLSGFAAVILAWVYVRVANPLQ